MADVSTFYNFTSHLRKTAVHVGEREIDLLILFQAIHHINKIISSKHD